MLVPRAYFGADEINGKIYVVGGQDWYHGGLATGVTEVFDPVTGSWDSVSTQGTFTKRDALTASSFGNKIYAMGGETLYDVNTNEVLTISSSSVESQYGKIYYDSRVFPNPATTTLNIVPVEPSMPFKIIDVLGRTVISGKTLDHSTLTLDISSLPRGAYFVYVERSDIKGDFAIAGKIALIGP